jgi:hypothetical protein
LFRSNFSYILKTILTIGHIYFIYRPVRFFFVLGLLFFIVGGFLAGRYFGLMLEGEGKGHIHSLIVCAASTLAGIISLACGCIAYLLGINRRLLEEIQINMARHNLKHNSSLPVESVIFQQR